VLWPGTEVAPGEVVVEAVAAGPLRVAAPLPTGGAASPTPG
jgi:hypothetical protein